MRNRLKVQKLHKAKVLDPTMINDKTYENYIALLTAILIDEEDEKDYKNLVYPKHLFDKEEEKKRIKEIDEMRAIGEQTELEKWYKSTFITEGNKKMERVKRIYSNIARKRNKRLREEKNIILNKYKEHIANIDNMSIEEIQRYKIKVINIVTDEINIYSDRKSCSEAIGIERKSITTYMKKKRIYKNAYLFTIANEKLSKEELQKLRKNVIRIRATNKNTGEEKIFYRLNDIANFFNMNYITFQQRFRYKKMREIRGWILEEIEIDKE